MDKKKEDNKETKTIKNDTSKIEKKVVIVKSNNFFINYL